MNKLLRKLNLSWCIELKLLWPITVHNWFSDLNNKKGQHWQLCVPQENSNRTSNHWNILFWNERKKLNSIAHFLRPWGIHGWCQVYEIFLYKIRLFFFIQDFLQSHGNRDVQVHDITNCHQYFLLTLDEELLSYKLEIECEPNSWAV